MRARLAACVIAGCAAGSAVPAARFANAPVVAAVDDHEDVAAQPAEHELLQLVYQYDGYFQRRLTRALELRRDQRALGVNALDEVPDSTWFTNRIGAREMTPEQVETGPLTVESPELHGPWIVQSTKIGGSSFGLIVKDTRGIKYLIKFDSKGHPEIETATHVIVNRLLWAAGYNVAEDQIVFLRPADLVVTKESKHKAVDGSTLGPLARKTLDDALAQVEHEPDGRIRALASRWLAGQTIGGHPAEGVRDDDPNDRIPHQLRRDLRGAYTIFGWVDHVDVQESNFVDTWIADPADSKRHYVKHYAVDFGKSLGGMAKIELDWRRGHTFTFDLPDILWTLVTLGTIERDWESRPMPELRGVGLFDSDTFDPGGWHSDYAAYVPFLTADDLDKAWGARIVARFTPAQIRAAVAAGKLSDRRSAEYVVATLIARQRAIAAYWFARVSPLSRFDASSGNLCFEDQVIAAGVAAPATMHYKIATFDFAGQRFGPHGKFAASRDGRSCVALPLASDARHADYTIVAVEAIQPDSRETIYVHVARDPGTRAPRVIGVWRP